jgi:hypothetical protein
MTDYEALLQEADGAANNDDVSLIGRLRTALRELRRDGERLDLVEDIGAFIVCALSLHPNPWLIHAEGANCHGAKTVREAIDAARTAKWEGE